MPYDDRIRPDYAKPGLDSVLLDGIVPDSTRAFHLTSLQRDLLERMELEAAMLAAPHDTYLRRTYFDRLASFAATRTGLSHALLPELGHPLYFRCGSSDIANMAQIFRDDAYGFDTPATPLRILDLGAYAGYAAVYLARRFPQAEIFCVEPSAASHRLLVLNTLPYRRIRTLNAAVWHHPTLLGVAARYYGDWGTQLQDQVPEAERSIPAHDMDGLIALAGWTGIDYLKCDIEGSEQAVFADPHAAWLRGLDVLAIETHEDIVPGSTATVAACFDPSLFSTGRHGETTLFLRRIPFRAQRRPPPRPLALLHSEPGLFPLALQDVGSDAWGFFTFDGNSCQLHPNMPGQPPARAVFPRTLDGHTHFRATIAHAGEPAATIVFSATVEREDGTPVAHAEHALAARSQTSFSLAFPPLTGRHRIVLRTEMAVGAQHNFNAWARWLEPQVT